MNYQNSALPKKSMVLNRYVRLYVWFIGIAAWLFGVVDRSFAAFADGNLSAIDLTQLLMVFFFLSSWLFLKPAQTIESLDGTI